MKAQNAAFAKKLGTWKTLILNPQIQTFQDVVNYNSKLSGAFLGLLDEVDGDQIPVTAGVKEYSDKLLDKWNDSNQKYQVLKKDDLAKYNNAMKNAGLPQIYWP